MTASLTGATVVVAGGTSGFGLQVARDVQAAGAEVVILGRDTGRLRSALATLGATARGGCVDLSDPAAAAGTFAGLGAFDHLVSTVGGAMGGGFLSAPLEVVRATVEGKLFANLGIARAAVPHLRPGGTLTFTAGSGGSPHTASGAMVGNEAIATMVRGLAVELAPDLRVNAVAPAWTLTGLWRDVPEADRAATERRMASIFPLGRTATVQEVADAYLFLMTATFVTGQTLHVDGGSSLVS